MWTNEEFDAAVRRHDARIAALGLDHLGRLRAHLHRPQRAVAGVAEQGPGRRQGATCRGPAGRTLPAFPRRPGAAQRGAAIPGRGTAALEPGPLPPSRWRCPSGMGRPTRSWLCPSPKPRPDVRPGRLGRRPDGSTGSAGLSGLAGERRTDAAGAPPVDARRRRCPHPGCR